MVKIIYTKPIAAEYNIQIFINMELTIQTPALLFPAISLLMLAFTNKFLAIANLIRNLVSDYEKNAHYLLKPQIASLKRRLQLIRWMQVFAVASMLFCVVTMYFVYEGWQLCAKLLFGIGLVLMMVSLFLCLIEIILSAGALRLILRDLEEKEKH